MKIKESSFAKSELIELHSDDWLKRQRVAGKVTSMALRHLESRVAERTTATMAELNQEADNVIRSNGCTPTFYQYKGFPASVCISINKQLVHGIPGSDRLQDGDVVKFDLGATYEGAIADSAVTCIFGQPKLKLHVDGVTAANECLRKAIGSIKVGANIGTIGHTIHRTAKNYGFNVITSMGGHGIGPNNPHSSPFVSNKSEKNDGVRICAGLTIAIEPLLVPSFCSTKTKTDKDGWSVITEDISFHVEHTVFVHDNYVEVITSNEV